VDIDTGSRLLLKVFSSALDDDLKKGVLPCSVLDAGCGIGVLGICAAGAVRDIAAALGKEPPLAVVFRDRDELARVFTEYNAIRNGIPRELFTAFTGPLLTGPQEQNWDLILTNIPAKAGAPVLEDFVRRSAAALNPGGEVFMVAVNSLAGFFRSLIAEAASPVHEEKASEHTVFVYRPPQTGGASGNRGGWEKGRCLDADFPETRPFYVRNSSGYEMEDIRYRLDTVYGAPDFDTPSGAVQAAAKLAVKLDLKTKLAPDTPALLIYEPDQGHFAAWLACYLGAPSSGDAGKTAACKWVLSGRNILSVGAARRTLDPENRLPVSLVPAADLSIDRERITAAACPGGHGAAGVFRFIAAFPETVPGTNRRDAFWEGLAALAAPGGIVIAGFSSAEAERFDRLKPGCFTRLGDVKRKGFRALAYILPVR
jgi:SAM-dependent methyltransferase